MGGESCPVFVFGGSGWQASGVAALFGILVVLIIAPFFSLIVRVRFSLSCIFFLAFVFRFF